MARLVAAMLVAAMLVAACASALGLTVRSMEPGLPALGLPAVGLSDLGALAGPTLAIARLIYADSGITGKVLRKGAGISGGAAVYFADVHGPVLERARETGLLDVVLEGRVFPTVDLAVSKIEAHDTPGAPSAGDRVRSQP